MDSPMIGERLRLARGVRARKEMAKLLGISEGALGNYENNKRIPTASILAYYAQELAVDLNWLVTGHEQIEPAQVQIQEGLFLSVYSLVRDRLRLLGKEEAFSDANTARIVLVIYNLALSKLDADNTLSKEQAQRLAQTVEFLAE